MKAKVRATGEIVDVKFIINPDPDVKPYWCAVNGKGNVVDYYNESEIELIDTQETPIDWEQRRYEIAKEAMIGILSNEDEVNYACSEAEYSKNEKHTCPKAISKYAVACADALIAELKKGNE